MEFQTYTSKKLSIASNENLSLDKITLIPSTTQLDEAVVTAQKQWLKYVPIKYFTMLRAVKMHQETTEYRSVIRFGSSNSGIFLLFSITTSKLTREIF